MPANAETLETALGSAVGEILEMMFYTAAWSGANAPADPLCAHLHFNGDPSGEFELLIAREAARTFAAAYLGSPEAELSCAAAEDVGCELANMICGATLSRLHPDSIVKLDSPEIRVPALGHVAQHFETPEGALSVAMRVD